MKRLFKIIFGLIFSILILVIAFVVYLFITISDPTDNAPLDLYKDNVTLNNEVVALVSDALGEGDKDSVYLDLTEEQINKIIFSVIKEKVNPDFRKEGETEDKNLYIYDQKYEDIFIIGDKRLLIKNIYANMDAKDKTISAFVTMNLMGLKTNLNLSMKLVQDNNNYKLKIERLALGDLNLFGKLGRFIIKNFTKKSLNENYINEILKEQKLPFVFEMDDLSINFTKEDIGELILSGSKNESNDNNKLINEFVTLLASSNNDIINFDFYEDQNSLGLKVNLKDIKYNESTDGITLYKFDYIKYNDIMNILISNETLTNENYKVIHSFLLKGYESLNSEEKNIINVIDFQSVDINDNISFKGLAYNEEYSNLNLEDYISKQIYQGIANLSDNQVSVNIDEEIINKILYTSGLLGTGFILYSNDVLVYSGIEAVWVDIVDSRLGLKMIYNLNGTKLVLFTEFNDKSTDGLVVDAEFDKLRLGTLEFSNQFKESIFNVISSSLKTDSLDSIEFVGTKIVIDSNKFIEDFDGQSTLSTIIDILKERDLITLNLVGTNLSANGSISFMMDLEPISSPKDDTEVPELIKKPFDTNLFITNKTQTLVFSNLGNINTPKITFTENDLNRMIYTNTNGYETFVTEQLLDDGITKLVIEVKAIMFKINSSKLVVEIIVDINGLESIIFMQGLILGNNTQIVTIPLDNNILIGEDVIISSNFILDLIGEDLGEMSIIEYNNEQKSFVLSSDSFEQMMRFGGNTPLGVDKISFTNGAIEVYVSYDDPILANSIDIVTDVFNSILESEFLNENQFNTSSQDQINAVNELKDQINNINQVLNDPEKEITPDLTNSLIESINNLSEENQDIFFEQMKEQADSSGGLTDLLNLYGSIFS